MAIHISHLSFEHYREAIGIGESKPRISWRFNGDAKSWLQNSYDLGIKRCNKPEEIYHIESQDSVLVPWPGLPLLSGEIAQVRVRAIGGSEKEAITTPWSDNETVETGLLLPSDWTCGLIEPDNICKLDEPRQPVLFRKSFMLKNNVKNARLYATAHGLYEVEINGKRVGQDVLSPGFTSYGHRLTYQTYNVTALLNTGDNAIGVHVAEGWYAGRLGFNGGRRNIWGCQIGFIGQLIVTYDDGSVETIAGDDSWRFNTGPIIRSEIYNGEVYNASFEQKGWSSPGFDESSWKSVKVHSLADIIPKLAPSDGPSIRRTQELPALKLNTSPAGKVIVDFGQNLVGWIRIQFPAPCQPGHTIYVSHSEVLDAGECAIRPLRSAAAKDTITLLNEPLLWEPKFTFHGFRFAQIDNWPTSSGIPELKDVTAIVVHTDMERTGWFECSEPMLNKLHENTVWGMRGNFLSIPTDCPQRDERLGWTGDIHVFAPTATFLYNVNGMLSGWLRDLASEQQEDGGSVPPLVSPNVGGPHLVMPNAVWSDCLVGTPWEVYKESGDIKVLERQYQSMQKWMGEGVPKDARGVWDISTTLQLGDWLDPAAPHDDPGNSRTNPLFVANAFLIGMTDLMSKISQVLGHDKESEDYKNTATLIRQHFVDDFITASGNVVGDSQTALALAIYFSLFPTKKQEDCAVERLDWLIRARHKFKIGTGFAGTPILGLALIYRMLLHKKCPSWLYPIIMGATTIWERWDSMLPDGSINPGEMTSFNHYALGSVANWMHQVMGGLSALEPGWKKSLIRPIPGGSITNASCRHMTPYGILSCKWTIVAKTFQMEIDVPPNTTAVVQLPGNSQQELIVGSGNHVFEEPYKPLEWPPMPIYPPFAPHDDDEP